MPPPPSSRPGGAAAPFSSGGGALWPAEGSASPYAAFQPRIVVPTTEASERRRRRLGQPLSPAAIHSYNALLRTVDAAHRDGRLLLVELAQPWCGMCTAVRPFLQKLSGSSDGVHNIGHSQRQPQPPGPPQRRGDSGQEEQPPHHRDFVDDALRHAYHAVADAGELLAGDTDAVKALALVTAAGRAKKPGDSIKSSSTAAVGAVSWREWVERPPQQQGDHPSNVSAAAVIAASSSSTTRLAAAYHNRVVEGLPADVTRRLSTCGLAAAFPRPREATSAASGVAPTHHRQIGLPLESDFDGGAPAAGVAHHPPTAVSWKGGNSQGANHINSERKLSGQQGGSGSGTTMTTHPSAVGPSVVDSPFSVRCPPPQLLQRLVVKYHGHDEDDSVSGGLRASGAAAVSNAAAMNRKAPQSGRNRTPRGPPEAPSGLSDAAEQEGSASPAAAPRGAVDALVDVVLGSSTNAFHRSLWFASQAGARRPPRSAVRGDAALAHDDDLETAASGSPLWDGFEPNRGATPSDLDEEGEQQQQHGGENGSSSGVEGDDDGEDDDDEDDGDGESNGSGSSQSSRGVGPHRNAATTNPFQSSRVHSPPLLANDFRAAFGGTSPQPLASAAALDPLSTHHGVRIGGGDWPDTSAASASNSRRHWLRAHAQQLAAQETRLLQVLESVRDTLEPTYLLFAARTLAAVIEGADPPSIEFAMKYHAGVTLLTALTLRCPPPQRGGGGGAPVRRGSGAAVGGVTTTSADLPASPPRPPGGWLLTARGQQSLLPTTTQQPQPAAARKGLLLPATQREASRCAFTIQSVWRLRKMRNRIGRYIDGTFLTHDDIRRIETAARDTRLREEERVAKKAAALVLINRLLRGFRGRRLARTMREAIRNNPKLKGAFARRRTKRGSLYYQGDGSSVAVAAQLPTVAEMKVRLLSRLQAARAAGGGGASSSSSRSGQLPPPPSTPGCHEPPTNSGGQPTLPPTPSSPRATSLLSRPTAAAALRGAANTTAPPTPRECGPTAPSAMVAELMSLAHFTNDERMLVGRKLRFT